MLLSDLLHRRSQKPATKFRARVCRNSRTRDVQTEPKLSVQKPSPAHARRGLMKSTKSASDLRCISPITTIKRAGILATRGGVAVHRGQVSLLRTGKTGRDHGTRFGGKQCPLHALLRSTRVSAGLRCIFITDSVQTVVRHLESVRSPRFSRHCTVRTPCITVRTPFIRLQTPYGLRVFYVRAPCVCLRRPNGLSYLWFRRCPLLPVFSRLLLAPSLPNNG